MDAWTAKRVEHDRKSYADAVNALSTEQLREAKSEIASVQAGTTKAVASEFGNDQMWPHLAHCDLCCGPHDMKTFDINKKFDEQLIEGMRRLLGRLGAVMLKYKIHETREGHIREWQTSHDSNVRYGYGFERPEGLSSAIEKYNELFGQLTRLNDSVTVAERNRKEAIAADRWDQA